MYFSTSQAYKYLSLAFVKAKNCNAALEYLHYATQLEFQLYNSSERPNKDTINTKYILGEIMLGREEEKEALSLFEHALAEKYEVFKQRTTIDIENNVHDGNDANSKDNNSNVEGVLEDEQCAHILEKISDLCLRQNKYYKCIDCLEHSLNIYASLKQFSEVEHIRFKLYNICKKDGRRDASLYYAEEMCKYYQNIESKRKEYVDSLYEVSTCLMNLRRHSKAIPLLKKSLEIAREIYQEEKHMCVVNILDALSTCLDVCGDIDQSFELLFEAQMIDDAISTVGKLSRYRVRGIVTLQTATMIMLEYGDMKARHLAQTALKLGDLSILDVRSPESINSYNQQSKDKDMLAIHSDTLKNTTLDSSRVF